jgi:outer membrane immunogenic protein
MKKLLLSTSFLVLGSAAVMAADLPMRTKAPMMAAPAFSWTGCYVGAHVGGGTMHDTFTNFEGTTAIGKGAIAGGQAGCNYQDGNWVFGVEGEGSWSGIKGSNYQTFSATNSEGFSTKNKNDFSIAARAGITFDRTLVYGKAGWAWGQFDYYSSSICCGVGATLDTTTGKATLDGLLVGVGIEHALTRNWTIKLEYNYLSFGSKPVAFTFCSVGVCSPNGILSESATKQIFKVGANYLFDIGGAPLVARY